MKILILGGNRFMGYFLAQKLLKEKHKVAILNRGSKQGIFGGKVEEFICDRNDTEKFHQTVAKHDFDIIFDNSAYHPEQAEASIEEFSGRIKQYVFISSVAVYDEKSELPYTENSPAHGKNPFGTYGSDKARCEQLLFKANKETGFPATIIRPTYVYGPRDYTDRMEKLLRQIQNEETLRIPKSNPKTQFVYVHNVVEALAACIGNRKPICQAYNICGDEIISYGELVEILGELIGKKPKVSFTMMPDFPYEDWTMYCDTTKSKKELKIKYTPLIAGVQETLDSA